MKLLLDHGAEVNARNVKGQTPLHFIASASLRTHVHAVFGASPEARRYIGSLGKPSKPSELNAKVMIILLEYGADQHAKDSEGKPPLVLARDDISNGWMKELDDSNFKRPYRSILRRGPGPDPILDLRRRPSPHRWLEVDAISESRFNSYQT